MPNFQVISKTAHAGKHFVRPQSYGFAACDALVPIVLQELAKACMVLPTAFAQPNGRWEPVAVQGLRPGQNVWVAPDGRWLGGYIPAAYRGYPFALLANSQGQSVLCMDMDSGLLRDAEGEVLLDKEGKPSQALNEVLEFLQQVAHNRVPTQTACDLLAQHQLLQPWALRVQTDEGEKPVQGLFCVHEEALRQLEAGALKALQQCGALQLAYMQLLSMQHIAKLGELTKMHAQWAQAQARQEEEKQRQAQATPLPVNKNGELDLEFLNQGGTLSFSNL